MKKIYPLIALAIVLVITGFYGLDHYRKLRAQQQAQTAHLITRCVNQGLLSLFTLQGSDWSKNPERLRDEEQRLRQRVSALPEAILNGKPYADWQGALEVCDRLTLNSNRQHRTIFRPLIQIAKKEMWNLGSAKSEHYQERRKKTIYRSKISAEAADRYLSDLQADIKRLLDISGLSLEARALTDQQLQTSIFNVYRKGRFSKRQVLKHLDQQETFYQLLADNPKGFTLRGGSLYFYNKNLHRKVDDLNRTLLQGEVDFFANWHQIVQR